MKKLILGFVTVLLSLFQLFLFDARAIDYKDFGVERIRQCSVNDGSPEGLDFNPLTAGKDVEFVMSNPVCVSVALTSYVAAKAGIWNMNEVCKLGGDYNVTPSPISDGWLLIKGHVVAARSGISSGDLSCAGAVAIADLSFGIAMAELGIIYRTASDVYGGTKICGSDWMKPNIVNYDMTAKGGYKDEVQGTVESYIRDNNKEKLNFSDKTYREWYYNGKEFEDNPVNGETPCYDITDAAYKQRNGNYPKQKYYLRGLGAGNFNCKKYLQYIIPGGRKLEGFTLEEAKTAYSCCASRSREYICIDYHTARDSSIKTEGAIFCKSGSRCTIDGITFEAYPRDNDRLVCAKTYSLCPYNFSIGGGSDVCDYYRDGIWDSNSKNWKMITEEKTKDGQCSPTEDSEIRNPDCSYNNKAGKCRNYCQYLTNCTTTTDITFRYNSSLTTPYASEACLNFAGDSQNGVGFGGDALGSQRHFTAPIVQCVKETLENLFFNRVGHSQCLNYGEYPDSEGVCPNNKYVTKGEFTYKKGNKVSDTSFFAMVQSKLSLIVKVTLSLSITFLGLKILVMKTDIRNKKEILTYVLKIGIILYFATGDAWQSLFFKGVYGASSEISKIVFKVNNYSDPEKRDGCQFISSVASDGKDISSSITYPAGKDYLSVWDTLDCKIARYLGFGPEASYANIAALIFSSFFTGSIGLYFSISILIFGLMLIAASIRALHIFLASSISIIVMVFVSPIAFLALLFDRTKSIFDQWLKELLGFCLQPIILFAYLAIFITIMDKALVGSATFNGVGPNKMMSCSSYCADRNDVRVPYINNVAPKCEEKGQHVVDPMDDSAACLLNFSDFGTFPGLEIIGISIKNAINLFSSNPKERILTILRAALVIYILYEFMDQIPLIAADMFGGRGLPESKANALQMFKSIAGAMAAIQERAKNGISARVKRGDPVGETKDLANRVGSKGGDKKDDGKGEGGDAKDGGGDGDESKGKK